MNKCNIDIVQQHNSATFNSKMSNSTKLNRATTINAT